MREILLVGGVAHLLAVAFHLALPRLAQGRAILGALPEAQQGVLKLFNAHVAYALLIFAVLSLGFARELLSTPSGRALCALIAGFWLLRAASEFVWTRAPSARVLALCLAMASVYVVAAFGVATGGA